LRKKFRLNSFLFFFALVFLTCSVNAEVQTLGTFTKGDTVFLTQTCDNCTYVNVTRIEFPRSAPQIINSEMTEIVKGNFNYSFSNTQEFGTYIVTTCGDPNGVYTCVSYDFEIGNIAFVYILLIGGIVLLGFATVLKIPIVGFASGILLSIAGVYFITLIGDLYSQAIGYTSLFIGIIVAFSASYEYFYE